MSTDLRAALERLLANYERYMPYASQVEDVMEQARRALRATPEPAPTLDVERLTFEEFRKEISDAIDRDGQHDWDEAARLADIIAAKVWNGLVGGAYALPAPLAKEPSDD